MTIKDHQEIGYFYDSAFLKHVQNPGHPECPGRLSSIEDALKHHLPLQKLLRHGQCSHESALEFVKKVHCPDYVSAVEQICQQGGGLLDAGDTRANQDSYDTALLAVGALLNGVDEIFSGSYDRAFCAVRPPGHHAVYSSAMGFCIFNNVVVAARYAQEVYGIKKILIVDFDVHHGNGAQDLLYDDADVFYFSSHQSPFYPGTGHRHEKGVGQGQGTTLNFPFPMGATAREVLSVYQDQLKEVMGAFEPDFLIISAGFDGHTTDPVGGFRLQDDFYVDVTKCLLEIANQYCQGRVLSALEGGYNLQSLGGVVLRHLEALTISKT